MTRLANRWARGDRDALDQLIHLVYDDLRRIAHRQLAGSGGGATVNTTGLVHEAFVKLAGASGNEWPSRGQFYAFCAKPSPKGHLMKASPADLATALAVPTVAALGGALAVYSGYDDAPGGLLMAVILLVGTVAVSLRATQRRS